MILRTMVVCLLSAMTLTASANDLERTERGVIITLDKASADKENDVFLPTKRVRIEVMGERLMRVTATPADTFPTAASLIIVPQTSRTPFDVEETTRHIIVKTAAVSAEVERKTGRVVFRDKTGREILAEDKRPREFREIERGGTVGYTVRQVFASPDDEAFFGLGQHQADEFNYKGRNEELFQYNTKVSVPFIVSNRRYGVLWDSYSLCRFGTPTDYSQLHRVFRLYDKDGRRGALTGTYTPSDKKRKTVVRSEDSLYFENLKTIKNLPQGFPLYGSTVVYEGEIEPFEGGLHRFILYYAGYVKVFIDNREVVAERWRTAWNPNAYKFAVSLKKGKRVPIRVEWRPDGGESYCGLRALPPCDEREQAKQSWWGEMQHAIDYYFISGESIDEVISGYRTLTGKAQVMPRWAMGYWQSRERYKTQKEMLGVLNEFRRREIPIDNIVLDWSHWPEAEWGSHEFDRKRFPDPKRMVDSIHALNARMMVSVWPKFYTATEHFREFDERGWMYRQSVRDSLRDWIGRGYTYGFYDAYSEGARKLFWKQMYDHYYPLGIDAWWMDASEPNVRDCTDMEYRKALCGPTALGPSDMYFNAYALMNADAIYSGQREADPDRRVFLLTRSGFAGLQRYSTATWSGDIATRWEDMKAQISAGLNFAVSGIPYWTMDIGGFCVEKRYEKAQKNYDRTGVENADLKEWRELNARWYQFGAFCPLFRSHGQWPLREPWNIAPEGHPAYESIVYYTKLRYRLMPYIYSLAGMTHFNDYTIMRPLVMDFTDDERVCNIGDQYMFGPALMVSPVYEYGARGRTVYFPKQSHWYDFYSGCCLSAEGTSATLDAPYGRIPLCVRAGSILPAGPDMQWADEKSADSLTLYVYAGNDGEFTLYEDENTNYNYERGAYSMISFAYDDAARTLIIGDRQGSFPGMIATRTFRIVLVSPDNAVPFGSDNDAIEVVYDGREKRIKL